jgi:hypothetical protein
MVDSAFEFKKAQRDAYERAMKLEGLHPRTRAAFEAVAPKSAAVTDKANELRSLPAVTGPEGQKPVTIEFVLQPNRNRILPPDSELNVYVRALEHHKRAHELFARFAAACGVEALKKELEALAAIELSLRNELQRRFDEWDANTYGSSGALNA